MAAEAEAEEGTVSLVDVLEEDEELEQEASAVLGGSDSEKCSYPEVRENTHTHTHGGLVTGKKNNSCTKKNTISNFKF